MISEKVASQKILDFLRFAPGYQKWVSDKIPKFCAAVFNAGSSRALLDLLFSGWIFFADVVARIFSRSPICNRLMAASALTTSSIHFFPQLAFWSSYHPRRFCESLFFELFQFCRIVPILSDAARTSTLRALRYALAYPIVPILTARSSRTSLSAREGEQLRHRLYFSKFFFVIKFLRSVKFSIFRVRVPTPSQICDEKKKRRTTDDAVVLFFNSKSGCPRSSCFVSSFESQHSPLPPTFRLAAIFSHERKRHASIAALD